MELLPKELIDTIPNLYETEEIEEKICHIKLFTPSGNFTWYIIELDKSNLDICFGYVQGLENELGYFSLKELKELKDGLGLNVERDLYFEPKSLNEIKGGER